MIDNTTGKIKSDTKRQAGDQLRSAKPLEPGSALRALGRVQAKGRPDLQASEDPRRRLR
jgi:hypothetical protein